MFNIKEKPTVPSAINFPIALFPFSYDRLFVNAYRRSIAIMINFKLAITLHEWVKYISE